MSLTGQPLIGANAQGVSWETIDGHRLLRAADGNLYWPGPEIDGYMEGMRLNTFGDAYSPSAPPPLTGLEKILAEAEAKKQPWEEPYTGPMTPSAIIDRIVQNSVLDSNYFTNQGLGTSTDPNWNDDTKARAAAGGLLGPEIQRYWGEALAGALNPREGNAGDYTAPLLQGMNIYSQPGNWLATTLAQPTFQSALEYISRVNADPHASRAGDASFIDRVGPLAVQLGLGSLLGVAGSQILGGLASGAGATSTAGAGDMFGSMASWDAGTAALGSGTAGSLALPTIDPVSSAISQGAQSAMGDVAQVGNTTIPSQPIANPLEQQDFGQFDINSFIEAMNNPNPGVGDAGAFDQGGMANFPGGAASSGTGAGTIFQNVPNPNILEQLLGVQGGSLAAGGGLLAGLSQLLGGNSTGTGTATGTTTTGTGTGGTGNGTGFTNSDAINTLLSLYALNQQGNTLDSLQNGIDVSTDVFGQHRGTYQNLFNMMNTDPDWMERDQVFTGMRNNALRSVAAQNASKGYMGSGNILHDLTRTATETAGNYALPRMQQVGAAAGAFFPPQNNSTAKMGIGLAQAENQRAKGQVLGAGITGAMGQTGQNPFNLGAWLTSLS